MSIIEECSNSEKERLICILRGNGKFMFLNLLPAFFELFRHSSLYSDFGFCVDSDNCVFFPIQTFSPRGLISLESHKYVRFMI